MGLEIIYLVGIEGFISAKSSGYNGKPFTILEENKRVNEQKFRG